MNKKISVVMAALFLLSACTLFSSSPSSVVKELIADAQKGDVNGMVSLWASKAVQEEGADKLRDNAQRFADTVQKAKAAGEDMQVQNLRETIQGDRARVFFIYRDVKGRDSVGMGFALLKENGKWKLYRSIDIGAEDQAFDSSFAETKPVNPEPTPPSEKDMVLPPPPPPANSNRQAATNSNSSSPITNNPAPISGGVLNNKAISLPPPTYPPVARAAKASGTVAVNVTVDENGRVISATALAGHPMLRPAAEAAARNARFNPTIVGGKRVKVVGTLTYQFSAQ